MAEIIYGGKSSKDYNLRVYNELTHELSSYDVETESVPGRDGVLLIDNQRLKPVERSFLLKLRDNVSKQSTSISEWLGVKGWHDLELSWDEGYIYQATVINTISIEEVLRQLGKLRVVFLVHPIKYFIDNLEQAVTNGETVINRGNEIAQPTIKLTGNGNTTININGRELVLEDVQGSITIDMKNKMVYSGNLSTWDKVVRTENTRFPTLDVGENVITWSGNFTMTMKKNEGVRI